MSKERFPTVFARPGVLVKHMVLAPGDEVPWHLHGHVRDTFYVLRGPVLVFTRQPEASVSLASGEVFQTGERQPHRVLNAGDREAEVLLIQGVGPYDFQPLDEAPSH